MTSLDGMPRSGEADARFRLFFERSSDAILLLDTASNHFVQYNDATLEMLRCTREELAALHPSALSPQLQPDGSDSFTRANEMIALALARGTHRFEWTHCSPHRPPFPVEVVLTPVTRSHAPMLMVVWRDITERKRTEEVQLRTQKLESLGLLASGIAHDFNNLLTAMMGNLALIRLELPDGSATEHLRHLDAAVQKAAHLTRQMLAYSGQGAFTVAPMDLGHEVRSMAELLATTVPKGVRLVFELDEQGATAKVDAAQVEQVIMNLVINAAEAIGEGGGVITLRTSLVSLDEAQLRRDFSGQQLSAGIFVRLEVQDTGAGMNPEVLSRIFDPFFSTKKSGRGLGLSALLGIVKAHQGGVLVRTAPGQGTTFSVYFPATSEPLARPPPAVPAPRQVHGSTVLLVEDEPMVRRSTRALLEKLGVTVLEAADGLEALEVFRLERRRVHCVLMDLTMPRMDGHTAFLALQQEDPTVKVILYSGWAATDVAARFRDHPPAGFLSKPFLLDEVLAALREAGVTAN
jgi:two-component system, cell cycle sensor histidine kinase and response regulator CckA